MCIDVCTWLPNKHTSYRCNHSSLPNTKKKAKIYQNTQFMKKISITDADADLYFQINFSITD